VRERETERDKDRESNRGERANNWTCASLKTIYTQGNSFLVSNAVKSTRNTPCQRKRQTRAPASVCLVAVDILKRVFTHCRPGLSQLMDLEAGSQPCHPVSEWARPTETLSHQSSTACCPLPLPWPAAGPPHSLPSSLHVARSLGGAAAGGLHRYHKSDLQKQATTLTRRHATSVALCTHKSFIP
jgi:hypothetical protein